MRARQRFAVGVLAAVVSGGRLAAVQTPDRRQLERSEQLLRQEGEAVLELADAAAQGSAVRSDFPFQWHNDFLKAQTGTFIPFVVSFAPTQLKTPAVLLYVRAARRSADDGEGRRRSRGRAAEGPDAPFEEIYPIDLAERGDPFRIARGFSLTPGEYDLIVVVRERERDDDRGRKPVAAVLRRGLSVPDFSGSELTTSTVIVADRLTVVAGPGPAGPIPDRPYVVAGREIQPAADTVFRREEELIVVFLVYNPAVTPDKHFDLEVEYHFFRKSGGGDSYVNRTEPQRFTRGSLGQYDPSAGQPLMAGQGVPLTGFQDGEYRLAITVTDRVSGRSISRDVSFTVRSS